MASVALSADADLNAFDFLGAGMNVGDWAYGQFDGIPLNGPISATAVWATRYMFASVGGLNSGFQVFEALPGGQFVRSFTRQSNGSLSCGSWAQVSGFDGRYVKSVNSATGAVSIGLTVS